MNIATTIRDPKILAQRRAELVEVATTLFLERGFHKTSIRDIARACPFNLAALYMYVSSKEDILYLVAEQLVNELIEAMEPARDEGNPLNAIALAFENYCSVVNRYAKHIRLLYRELDLLSPDAREKILASVESLQSVFERLIVRGVEAKVVREVNPKLAALDMMVLAHAWALHGRTLRSHSSIEQFTREQREIVINGLVARP